MDDDFLTFSDLKAVLKKNLVLITCSTALITGVAFNILSVDRSLYFSRIVLSSPMEIMSSNSGSPVLLALDTLINIDFFQKDLIKALALQASIREKKINFFSSGASFEFSEAFYSGNRKTFYMLKFSDAERYDIFNESGEQIGSGKLGERTTTADFSFIINTTSPAAIKGEKLIVDVVSFEEAKAHLLTYLSIGRDQINKSVLQIMFNSKKKETAEKVTNSLQKLYRGYVESYMDLLHKKLVKLVESKEKVYEELQSSYRDYAFLNLIDNVQSLDKSSLKEFMDLYKTRASLQAKNRSFDQERQKINELIYSTQKKIELLPLNKGLEKDLAEILLKGKKEKSFKNFSKEFNSYLSAITGPYFKERNIENKEAFKSFSRVNEGIISDYFLLNTSDYDWDSYDSSTEDTLFDLEKLKEKYMHYSEYAKKLWDQLECLLESLEGRDEDLLAINQLDVQGAIRGSSSKNEVREGIVSLVKQMPSLGKSDVRKVFEGVVLMKEAQMIVIRKNLKYLASAISRKISIERKKLLNQMEGISKSILPVTEVTQKKKLLEANIEMLFENFKGINHEISFLETIKEKCSEVIIPIDQSIRRDHYNTVNKKKALVIGSILGALISLCLVVFKEMVQGLPLNSERIKRLGFNLIGSASRANGNTPMDTAKQLVNFLNRERDLGEIILLCGVGRNRKAFDEFAEVLLKRNKEMLTIEVEDSLQREESAFLSFIKEDKETKKQLKEKHFNITYKDLEEMFYLPPEHLNKKLAFLREKFGQTLITLPDISDRLETIYFMKAVDKVLFFVTQEDGSVEKLRFLRKSAKIKGKDQLGLILT